MEFLTDYTDRQVDIEALQSAESPAKEIRLSKSMTGGDKHRRITGLQKLVQRYAILFLTRLGSSRFAPLIGTDFVDAAQRGFIKSRDDVSQLFSFANRQVTAILLNDATTQDSFGEQPEDEQFDRAELEDFTIDTASGYLYLRIRVYSASGDNANFILPVQ